ncbi:hypothetical protein [Lentzea jiangxiensis]|nr:hypothetical protein [Lentzea jiangxiensis]
MPRGTTSSRFANSLPATGMADDVALTRMGWPGERFPGSGRCRG